MNNLENTIQPISKNENRDASHKLKIEKIKQYLEVAAEEKLLACLSNLETESVSIGKGNNAEVLAIPDATKAFSHLCVKKLKKYPKIKINDPDIEFDFQKKLHDIGINVPLNIITVQDQKTRQEYMIMTRVRGISLGDAIDPHNAQTMPDLFNHESFFKKLREMVNTMHEHHIHHRDLHRGNIMVDHNGDPVIIDFGSACYDHGLGGDENLIYMGEGRVLIDEEKGIYANSKSMLLQDLKQLDSLEQEFKKYTF